MLMCLALSLCLHDNLLGYRLSVPRGRSDAAGTKRGQYLEVKTERYKQPKFPKLDLREGLIYLLGT